VYSEFARMSLRPTLIDANQLQAIRQILNRNQMSGGGAGGNGGSGGFSFGIGGGINRGLRRMGSFLGFLGQENNGRVRVFFILFFFVMIGVFLYYRYHAKQQGEVLNNDSIYGRFLKAVGFDNKPSGSPDVLPPSVVSNTVAQMGSLHPFVQPNTAPKSTTNYMIPNYRPVPTAQIPEDITYNPQLNNPQYNTHFVHLNNPPKYASTQNHPSYEHPPNVYYPQQSYGGQGFSGQGFSGQGFSGQGFSGQGFSGQGYEDQGYNGQGYNYPPSQSYSQEVPFTYQQHQNYGQQNYHQQQQQQQRQPVQMQQQPPSQQQMYNTTSRYTATYDPTVY